jgi:hypothetical protein
MDMEKSETLRLVDRIDADIRKMQEWRAYVLGESMTHPTDAPKPKRGRKPRSKPGLPTDGI